MSALYHLAHGNHGTPMLFKSKADAMKCDTEAVAMETIRGVKTNRIVGVHIVVIDELERCGMNTQERFDFAEHCMLRWSKRADDLMRTLRAQ